MMDWAHDRRADSSGLIGRRDQDCRRYLALNIHCQQVKVVWLWQVGSAALIERAPEGETEQVAVGGTGTCGGGPGGLRSGAVIGSFSAKGRGEKVTDAAS